MRKSLFILFFLLVVLFTFLTLQYFGVTSVGLRIGFQTIRKGTRGGKDSGYYVIQNAEQWNEICKSVFPPDAMPEINFSNTTVIAVFMGLRPTAGYAIEVKEITDTIFRVVVKVAWITPGGKILPQILTSPYHIIKTQKINEPITFQIIWETHDC